MQYKGALLVIAGDGSDYEPLSGLFDDKYTVDECRERDFKPEQINLQKSYSAIIIDSVKQPQRLVREISAWLVTTESRWLPIIYMSWDSDIERGAVMLPFGVIDHLAKPVAGAYLIAKVDKLQTMKACVPNLYHKDALSVLSGASTLDISKHIMLVEDNPMDVQLLREALSPDCRITLAKSGEEANALLDQGKDIPDVVLLDINLGDCSGYDLLRKIKSDQRFRHVPIAFTSAVTRQSKVIDGLRMGACDYFTKPYSSVLMSGRLTVMFRLRHLMCSAC